MSTVLVCSDRHEFHTRSRGREPGNKTKTRQERRQDGEVVEGGDLESSSLVRHRRNHTEPEKGSWTEKQQQLSTNRDGQSMQYFVNPTLKVVPRPTPSLRIQDVLSRRIRWNQRGWWGCSRRIYKSPAVKKEPLT